MQRLGCIAGIVLALLIVFIFGIYVVSVVESDMAAKATMEDIKSVPLPEGAELVDEIYVAGKLVGNGNGAQYFGAILVESDMELYEIDGYYNTYRKDEWDYIVKEQLGFEIDVIEHGSYSFDAEMNEGRHYIVYSWGDKDTIFADWDIRSH